MIELGTHHNSPLCYPGSKGRRAVRLLRLADQDRCQHLEPFAGGLGMLFRARRERMFRTYRASDSDDSLMNLWRVLRDYPEELVNRLWTFYRRHGTGSVELFHQCREPAKLVKFDRDRFLKILQKNSKNEALLFRRLAKMLGNRLLELYPTIT